MQPSAVMGKAERVTAGDKTWGRPSLGAGKPSPAETPSSGTLETEHHGSHPLSGQEGHRGAPVCSRGGAGVGAGPSRGSLGQANGWPQRPWLKGRCWLRLG